MQATGARKKLQKYSIIDSLKCHQNRLQPLLGFYRPHSVTRNSTYSFQPILIIFCQQNAQTFKVSLNKLVVVKLFNQSWGRGFPPIKSACDSVGLGL